MVPFMVMVEPAVVDVTVPLLSKSFLTLILSPAKVKNRAAFTVKLPTFIPVVPKLNPVVENELSTITLLINVPVYVPTSVNVWAIVPLNFSVEVVALAVITPVLLIDVANDNPNVNPFKLNVVVAATLVVSVPMLASACKVTLVLATETVSTPLVGVAAGGNSFPVLIAAPPL